MLTLIVAAAVLTHGKAETITVPVKESAWVYVHSGDPTGDEFLRIWGAEGVAAPETPGGTEDFSFGFLKFEFSGLPSGKPKKAVLVLHNAAPAAFEADDLRQTPLQARELTGSFSAANWGANTAAPGPAKTVFGIGKLLNPMEKTVSPEIDIDLLKGPNDIGEALIKAESATEHVLYLALTSAIQPNSQGGSFSGIYKIYSANAKDKALRPVLRLEF